MAGWLIAVVCNSSRPLVASLYVVPWNSFGILFLFFNHELNCKYRNRSDGKTQNDTNVGWYLAAGFSLSTPLYFKPRTRELKHIWSHKEKGGDCRSENEYNYVSSWWWPLCKGWGRDDIHWGSRRSKGQRTRYVTGDLIILFPIGSVRLSGGLVVLCALSVGWVWYRRERETEGEYRKSGALEH